MLSSKTKMTNTVIIHIHGKPVVLTAETIDATWKWFADHERECARAALAKEFHVNDLTKYVERCNLNAEVYDNNEGRMSVAFLQRAYFIQTGESVPLLP